MEGRDTNVVRGEAEHSQCAAEGGDGRVALVEVVAEQGERGLSLALRLVTDQLSTLRELLLVNRLIGKLVLRFFGVWCEGGVCDSFLCVCVRVGFERSGFSRVGHDRKITETTSRRRFE